MLSEIYRNYATNQICQVDVADIYDHKHQEMSADDRTRGLSRMSVDIAKSLFRKMATTGEVFTTEKFRTIKAAYFRIALDLVDSYGADAEINTFWRGVIPAKSTSSCPAKIWTFPMWCAPGRLHC